MNNVYHVIKDPVHGTMQFTSIENGWVKPFIDSPTFQRLRHIKQLGMADFIFPGAVHTRFNHCLGCCYVASQIAYKIGLEDDGRQLVMIACLLHDIGHGPFSHTFEDIFHEKLIRHEDWTPYFLNEYRNADFFQRYNQVNPAHPLSEEKFATVAQMIMHQPVANNLLADIVSSQLDADRFDYLLRDSHFCGVRYGEYDFRWMLHCLAIVESDHGARLGITHKGIGVVEQYLMARRLMTRNIYQSQKKLALEYFLIQLLANLAQSLENYSAHAEILRTRLGQFLLAVNQFNQRIKKEKLTPAIKREFLQSNYKFYKDLCDYDIFALVNLLAGLDDNHPATQLAKRITNRKMPKIITLEGNRLEAVNVELKTFKQQHAKDFQDWQIAIIRNPHRSYTKKADPILVSNRSGDIQTISHMSVTIDAISDKLEYLAFLSIDSEIANHPKIKNFLHEMMSELSTA